MGRTACTEPQCLYSTAIPLLPLWAIQPVQTLSACTVQLYLYSSYEPYGLHRASVPVQYSYTSTPLSACTRVHFILLLLFTYLGVGGQRHAPAVLPPGKNWYVLYKKLGGPQGQSGRVRKISLPLLPGFNTRTFQPLASRYTH